MSKRAQARECDPLTPLYFSFIYPLTSKLMFPSCMTAATHSKMGFTTASSSKPRVVKQRRTCWVVFGAVDSLCMSSY